MNISHWFDKNKIKEYADKAKENRSNIESVDVFLNKLYELESVDRQIDTILDWMEDSLWAGEVDQEWPELLDLLKKLDPSRVSTASLFSILGEAHLQPKISCTAEYKRIFDYLYEWYDSRGEEADYAMQGLFPTE